MKQLNINYSEITYTKEARCLLKNKSKILYSAEDGVILETKNAGEDLSLSYGQVVSILCSDLPFMVSPGRSYFIDKFSGELIEDLGKHKEICNKKYLTLKRRAIDHIAEIRSINNLNLNFEDDTADILHLRSYLHHLKAIKNSKSYPLNIEWPKYPLEAACQ